MIEETSVEFVQLLSGCNVELRRRIPTHEGCSGAVKSSIINTSDGGFWAAKISFVVQQLLWNKKGEREKEYDYLLAC